MAEKLDSSNFDSFLENSSVPVLVDFYSDGCIPCRRIAPLISKAENEYDTKVKFAKVNIGMNPDLIAKYSIEAAPTLVVLNDGVEINRLVGAADADTLKNFIDSILNIKEKNYDYYSSR